MGGDDKSESRAARIEDALRWYADESRYTCGVPGNEPEANEDMGERARKALEGAVHEGELCVECQGTGVEIAHVPPTLAEANRAHYIRGVAPGTQRISRCTACCAFETDEEAAQMTFSRLRYWVKMATDGVARDAHRPRSVMSKEELEEHIIDELDRENHR